MKVFAPRFVNPYPVLERVIKEDKIIYKECDCFICRLKKLLKV